MHNTENYKIHSVRPAAILTTGYIAGTVLGPVETTSGMPAAHPSRYNQLNLLASFTIGSLTDAQIKIEFSHDGVTYYQETADSAPSTGVVTESVIVRKLTATGNYRITLPIKDNYIKISAIGTGTVTSSSLKIDAVLGTV